MLALGDSDRVRVGDVVLAIGNPLGIGQTVTMGIISAKGRQTGLSSGSFEDFLQTDAPINQGNSGGALVSTNSELIGINSQILSPSGGSIGIGFSIPSNMARTIADTLVKEGKVRRGQLGILVTRPNSDAAKELGIRESKEVVVTQVQPGSAADSAGLRKGTDHFLQWGGGKRSQCLSKPHCKHGAWFRSHADDLAFWSRTALDRHPWRVYPGTGKRYGAGTMSTAKRTQLEILAFPVSALLLVLACLAFAPDIAAQTSAQSAANTNDSDPLHQFNSSVRALVKRVSPSVVQVLVTGSASKSRAAPQPCVGRQERLGQAHH